jgi:two-component system chemotaxis sensor kinase CheA
MAIDLDDEILQDFLVEAGELLEQLGEQLVELEQSPQDKELLNAVFRGFHTVKGGAGFLNLEHLVAICHRAEDVFNVLRQGERVADAQLMDVVLRALDVVNDMVDQVRAGTEPGAADPALLSELERFACADTGEAAAPEAPAPQAPVEEAPPAAEAPAAEAPEQAAETGEVAGGSADELFDQMLDEAAGAGGESEQASGADDEITEAEFENLLDQLHGSGGAPGQGAAADQPAAATPAEQPAASTGAEASSKDITDDEFEQLLDELQANNEGFAKGLKQGEAAQSQPAAVAAAPTPQPEPAPARPAVQESKASDEAAAARASVPAETKSEDKPAAAPAKAAAGAKDTPAAASGQPQAETTVRVDTKRLDDIMNLVGELVLVRNRLATLRNSMGDEVSKVVSNLDLVTADLQNAVMKTRMQPIKKVFGRFPRVVRDLARSLNKQVSLELQGEETDLDKNLVEALADPLVHLVRNAVDHGVEAPDVRQKAGKPASGTVVLAAEQEGDHILLSITDDGAGMDPNVLRAKAVEKGVMDEDAASRLDDHACYNLIFHPGFSTKSEISDISGRGVGMDVVKTRITQLNGTIDIDSHLGKGSRIIIKVPLTLAIMPTLMVQLHRQIFALPLANVIEIFDSESAKISTVDGKRVVIVREKAIPMVYLRDWLVQDPDAPRSDTGYVVVVSYGSQHVGCVVDQLIGQEEVVIKPLGTMLQGTQGLAGATITGNGRIALILDMPSLMETYARKAS